MIGMTAKTLNTLLEFVLVIYFSITANSKKQSFRTNGGFWANLMRTGHAYLDRIGSKKRYLCETSVQTTFDLYTLDHLIFYTTVIRTSFQRA